MQPLRNSHLGSTIVLANADADFADALAGVFAEAGYSMHRAATGVQALEACKAAPGSIAVIDAHLPDMEGLELLARLRRHDPSAQVIVTVGRNEIELGVQCLQKDASDFIVKPVSRAYLEVCLERAHDKVACRQNVKKYSENLGLLHATQLTLQQLFDEVPCYISVQNKNFRLTRANRRFKEDFGDYIGAYCYEVYKHRSEPCPNCPVDATFTDGTPYQTEEIVTTKTGKQYNVLTWTAPIRDASGEISEVLEIATDITQIRELQGHLTNLGLMIGSVSHGVKGMLTALDGGMYKLDTGVKNRDFDKIDQGATLIREMVNRVRNTVLDILYYAKERDLHWESVNVVDFAKEVAATVEPKAKNSGVAFVRDIDSSLGVFEIDPSVISSALVNILENAVDACSGDSAKEEHEIVFKVWRANGDIIFQVRDNGMGMDRPTQEKMFSLFFSSKGSKGTGLGLYIANEVIEQHGGNIKVDSTLGEGTVFTITLPKACPWKAGEGPRNGQA